MAGSRIVFKDMAEISKKVETQADEETSFSLYASIHPLPRSKTQQII